MIAPRENRYDGKASLTSSGKGQRAIEKAEIRQKSGGRKNVKGA
jgi:hypothetical protein